MRFKLFTQIYKNYIKVLALVVSSRYINIPVDTGRKLNVHKTFRRRPGCLLNVLCTFNLRPVYTGILAVAVSSRYINILALTVSSRLMEVS